MRASLLLSTLLGLSAGLSAQANDFSGLRVFDAGNPSNGAPARLSCSTPFSCTPDSFTAPQGATLGLIVMGQLNTAYAVLVTFDQTPVCIDLGISGLANRLALNPNAIIPLVSGVMTQSDNGRCNGAFASLNPLFTIPTGLPAGALKFQAVSASPLSGGGNGFALSNTVAVNY